MKPCRSCAIAEAVDAAHLAGVAHRDLKPDNVFVLDAGVVKLIDFGLAKLVDDVQTPVTVTGSMFGTPLYMSPEQCRGKSDARTDLYSFGAMAFHVLTGEPPFTGSPLELALHHLNDPPPRTSSVFGDLPPHVDRVLDALLAKDPDHRPAPLTAAVAALAGEVKLARRRRWLGSACRSRWPGSPRSAPRGCAVAASPRMSARAARRGSPPHGIPRDASRSSRGSQPSINRTWSRRSASCSPTSTRLPTNG